MNVAVCIDFEFRSLSVATLGKQSRRNSSKNLNKSKNNDPPPQQLTCEVLFRSSTWKISDSTSLVFWLFVNKRR